MVSRYPNWVSRQEFLLFALRVSGYCSEYWRVPNRTR